MERIPLTCKAHPRSRSNARQRNLLRQHFSEVVGLTTSHCHANMNLALSLCHHQSTVEGICFRITFRSGQRIGLRLGFRKMRSATAWWLGTCSIWVFTLEIVTFCRFSISKWIHLNGGDEALKTFFRRVYNVLESGGTFILEPQAWETYAKAKRMDEVLSISIRLCS